MEPQNTGTPETPEPATPEPPAPPPQTPLPPPPEAATPSEPAPVETPTEEGEAPAEEKPKKAPKPKKRPPYEMKLFERYDITDIAVHDLGLAKYINLNPIVIPHTGGRWANKPFGKQKANIVERLINGMMRTEVYTGKKSKAYRVVRTSFELIEKKANKNPVQVLVEALEHAAPREEITRLRFGGISVPRAVDISPSRRLDMALRNITIGAVQATFKNRKPVEECLADEIFLAAKGDMQSSAIAKKEELERVASSAR
ncbi:MAG TPA: 30S ribosomal protein S7 [Thermoplasmata archaeon]|nr:30S ribosomal protein S7 [Thermoplasmata archaeon]